MSLETYFSDQNIVRILCRIRIKEASLAHDLNLPHRLKTASPNPFNYETAQYLPPRSQWDRFRPRYRQQLGSNHAASMSLYHATLNLRNRDSEWSRRLTQLICNIRERVFGSQRFSFSQPTSQAIRKEGNIYRPVSTFNLVDRIIDSLTTRYLRDQLDHVLEPESMAFRSTVGGRTATHHTAINDLIAFRTNHRSSNLYVAECDIQAFFDCVPHQIARDQFTVVLNRHHSVEGSEPINQRAVEIFQAYLECYNFRDAVWNGLKPAFQQIRPAATFKWPVDDLQQLHGNINQVRLGIPQGGAMSGLIANIVLDAADKQVRAEIDAAGGATCYRRYCDDMVIVATSKQVCQQAFNAYLTALDSLKLPYHQPKWTWVYGKRFWEAKSKHPYRWTGLKSFNCVPWIQFVGYQLRYDGLMRVRKGSLVRHRDKIVLTTNRYIHALLPPAERNPQVAPIRPDTSLTMESIQKSLKGRLTAMAVGRSAVGHAADGPRTYCWTNGFKALHGQPFVGLHLKRLDRNRERAIRRFARKPIRYGAETITPTNNRRPRLTGYLNSYFAQFNNQDGNNLVLHPYQPTEFERRFLVQPFLFVRWAIRSVESWMAKWQYWQKRLTNKSPHFFRQQTDSRSRPNEADPSSPAPKQIR